MKGRWLLGLVVSASLAGCGGVGTSGADADLTLLLAGPPSGLDAGVFLAMERGFDEAEGIELDVRGTGDPKRLLRNDRVQAVVLRRDDVAGSGATCVMALLQAPVPDRFVCVSPTLLEGDRAEVVALVKTLQRGYNEAAVDPESGVQAVLTARSGLDRDEVAAELDARGSDFVAGAPAIGFLRRDALPPGDFAYGLVGPVSRD